MSNVSPAKCLGSPSTKCVYMCKRSYDKETDPTAFVVRNAECDVHIECYSNKSSNSLHVCVRGTDSYVDVIKDVSIWQVPCRRSVIHEGTLTDLAFDSDAKVHQGFLNCSTSVAADVISWINKNKTDDCELFFTGHSLGGATAALLAFQLKPSLVGCRICVMTFGCPRVGNREFARVYNSLIPRHFRYSTTNDIVSCFPIMGYYHVGHSVYLDDNTSMWQRYIGVPVPNAEAHKMAHYVAAIHKLFPH